MPNAWRSLGAESLSLWDRTISWVWDPLDQPWRMGRETWALFHHQYIPYSPMLTSSAWSLALTHQAPQQWWAENSIYAHASTSSKKAGLRLLLSHSRSFVLYALDFPTQKPPSLGIKRTGYPVKGSEGREAKFPMDRDQQEAERTHRKPGELPTISLLLPRLTRQHK